MWGNFGSHFDFKLCMTLLWDQKDKWRSWGLSQITSQVKGHSWNDKIFVIFIYFSFSPGSADDIPDF